jgi:hypothetical protein
MMSGRKILKQCLALDITLTHALLLLAALEGSIEKLCMEEQHAAPVRNVRRRASTKGK